MSEVLKDLDQQPGRRVLLAITDGGDDGSKTRWKDVMFHAQIRSETVFGLVPINPLSFDDPEDKFRQICEDSGGIELQAKVPTTLLRLKEFTQMLRERYILEYPRGPNEEAGLHTIEVSYRKKSNLYIATTGITVPIASEDEKESMKTMQADPSRTPPVGTRKALPKF
jgi:hypothetical protein